MDHGLPRTGVGYASEKLFSCWMKCAEIAVCAWRNSTPGRLELSQPTVAAQRLNNNAAAKTQKAGLISLRSVAGAPAGDSMLHQKACCNRCQLLSAGRPGGTCFTG